MNTLKSLTSIWEAIANDSEVEPKTIDTLKRRVGGAGLPFLLIDLPGLGKDLDRALSTGYLVITSRFKSRSKRDVRPAFLFELFKELFDETGLLYDKVDPVKIRALRQLLMVFYKFKQPFTPLQEQEAFEKYRDVDASVKEGDWHWSLPIVRKYFESLFPDDPLDVRCHFSSGRTADRISNLDKRKVRRFIPSLHRHYGFGLLFQNHAHINEHSVLDTEVTEPRARIVFIPKDSRGPRTICMEPHERMFVQKGIQTKLYEYTETDSPAKGKINFTDQSINQRLAQKASMDRSLATIDLKDASDLVSWDLICELLRDKPEWLEALKATRSTVADFEGEFVNLKKFASMGSALCFPIEAFLFWSIIRPITAKVWVYGDDLIVPTHLVGKIMDRLELYGLRINRSKSLFIGDFRESCGGEYFRGADITYARIKSLEYEKYIAACNVFTQRAGLKTAESLVLLFERLNNVRVLRSPDLSGRARPMVFNTPYASSSSVFFKRRWNEDLQRWELRVLTVSSSSKSSATLDGYDAFFNWLTVSNSDTAPEDAHTHRRLCDEFDVLTSGHRSNLMPCGNTAGTSWDTRPRNKWMWLPEMVIANSKVYTTVTSSVKTVYDDLTPTGEDIKTNL